MLDVFHMDPAQYAQPVPANQNFSFELLFDRSAEVNASPRGRSVRDDKWDSDPTRVGVLHDIYQLYSAIGAGISRGQRAYIKRVLDDQIKGEINALSTLPTNEITGEQYSTPDEAYSEFVDAKNSFIDLNIGNSGFMVPTPVRAVFSEHYMVEGLVQSVQVQLVKFDANMIPMMANVVVTMEAKYLGFAKARTFLTQALTDRENSSLLDNKKEGGDGTLYGLVSGLTSIKAALTANVSGGADKEELASSSTNFRMMGRTSSNTSNLSYLRVYPNLPKMPELEAAWREDPSHYSLTYSRMPGIPIAVYRLAPSFAKNVATTEVNQLRALQSGVASVTSLSSAIKRVVSMINTDYSTTIDQYALWAANPSLPSRTADQRGAYLHVLSQDVFPRTQVVREERFDPLRFDSYLRFKNHREGIDLWTNESEYISFQPEPWDTDKGTPGNDDRAWNEISQPGGGSSIVLTGNKGYADNFSNWDWLIVYGLNITLTSTDDIIVGYAVGYKWIPNNTAPSSSTTDTKVTMSVYFAPQSQGSTPSDPGQIPDLDVSPTGPAKTSLQKYPRIDSLGNDALNLGVLI